MAVKSDKLGPGSLKFGETGSEVEFAVGLREAAVEPDFKDDDGIPVLSGEEIAGDAEESYKVTGKLLQSYDLSSFLIWAKVNNGKTVPFMFRPDNDKALGVKGQCVIRRMTIGGKVKERNESDFEFTGVGDFDFVNEAGSVIATYTVDPAAPTTPTEDATPQWD